jgi:hypothetical protein
MQTLQIDFTEQQVALLTILVNSGIWGDTLEETAKQIVLDGLKETVGRSTINASRDCAIAEPPSEASTP